MTKKPFKIQKTFYAVNGKEVQNLSDLPQNVRSILEDKDQDGQPDIMQNMLANNLKDTVKINSVKVNGQPVNDLNQLSVEIQKRVNSPFAKFFLKMFLKNSPMNAHPPMNQIVHHKTLPLSPSEQSDPSISNNPLIIGSDRRRTLILICILFDLALIGGIWFYFKGGL